MEGTSEQHTDQVSIPHDPCYTVCKNAIWDVGCLRKYKCSGGLTLVSVILIVLISLCIVVLAKMARWLRRKVDHLLLERQLLGGDEVAPSSKSLSRAAAINIPDEQMSFADMLIKYGYEQRPPGEPQSGDNPPAALQATALPTAAVGVPSNSAEVPWRIPAAVASGPVPTGLAGPTPARRRSSSARALH